MTGGGGGAIILPSELDSGGSAFNQLYRGADKSLAQPISRCIFLIVRIFRLMLVLLYI
jgi:hypothetical protein